MIPWPDLQGQATSLRLAVGAARLEQIAVECFQKANRVLPPWWGAREWRRGVSDTATCQYRGLHRRHDLARLGADHREAENEVIISTDKSLHKALCFVRCLCAQDRGHRKFRHPHRDAVALRVRSLSPTCASGGSVNMQ